MHTILVIFNSPENLGIPKKDLKDGLKGCFRVRKYRDTREAFDAYANTSCIWSRLLDDSINVESFIDEAIDAIENNDQDWLEQNFV